ncbi:MULTISPECIES: hypothetical protein [Pseudomonas]|jgi:hypothetical protein|uniref:Uncharacterized protein n=7 Tax=Pseudomonas TaxID=286 RepID=A0AAW5AE06_9PSED|nr:MULTISPECIES: hypothetical protein [Pseudomonas]SBW85100.1 hypothetical protein PVE_P0055 [Pseudomonas veronii 1YdBTEX2]KAA0943649.1 hypothetical protein FQ182_23850 [Pseudomonas sp. ANT_H4]KAA0946155.1 hypothetical protein FQ186_27415 [Pseudomonas sp. ANT_H14]KAA0973872.1 hypothetical protein FQ185_12950 [Pseudomonas sp. ANT_H12B]KAA8696189.1 hypothetical protein F4W61_27970 [Pseudomonas proteolytica]
MIQRFVVVPAIPTETGSVRNGARFHSTTVPAGFDIYDNQGKQRLQFTYSTRIEADAECERLNMECDQTTITTPTRISSP